MPATTTAADTRLAREQAEAAAATAAAAAAKAQAHAAAAEARFQADRRERHATWARTVIDRYPGELQQARAAAAGAQVAFDVAACAGDLAGAVAAYHALAAAQARGHRLTGAYRNANAVLGYRDRDVHGNGLPTAAALRIPAFLDLLSRAITASAEAANRAADLHVASAVAAYLDGDGDLAAALDPEN